MNLSEPIRAPQVQAHVKTIRMHSYAKCARNALRITLMPNKELKVAYFHIVAHSPPGGGGRYQCLTADVWHSRSPLARRLRPERSRRGTRHRPCPTSLP